MIFRGLMVMTDEDSIVIFPMLMVLMVSIFICSHLIQNYSLLCFSIMVLILTEIYYHIEPRTKDDKKKGRDWFRVSYKKIDSLFDAILTTGILTLIYEGSKRITVDGLLRFAEILGIVVLSIAAVIIYIWLNGLRDKPKKRGKKR